MVSWPASGRSSESDERPPWPSRRSNPYANRIGLAWRTKVSACSPSPLPTRLSATSTSRWLRRDRLRRGGHQVDLRDRRLTMPAAESNRGETAQERESRDHAQRRTKSGGEGRRRPQVAVGGEHRSGDRNRKGGAEPLQGAVHAGGLAHVMGPDRAHDGARRGGHRPRPPDAGYD